MPVAAGLVLALSNGCSSSSMNDQSNAGGGASGTGASGGTSGGGGTAGSSNTGGSGGTAGTPTDGGGTDGDAPSCTVVTHSFSANADSNILNGSSTCNGTIIYGLFKYGNLNSFGRAIIRFDLGADDVTALQGGKVQSLTLTLGRSPDCDGDSACNGIAPVQGTLSAYSLTNDWAEGTSNSGTDGADWCRRKQGVSWSQPGAEGSDRGTSPSSKLVLPSDASADIDLDPAQWADVKWTSGNQLSVVVQTDDAVFLYVTHESSHTSLHPQLTISYCP
jgi:hypothetical protein